MHTSPLLAFFSKKIKDFRRARSYIEWKIFEYLRDQRRREKRRFAKWVGVLGYAFKLHLVDFCSPVRSLQEVAVLIVAMKMTYTVRLAEGQP